ncbi:MAG: hypothetical protein ABJO27_09915 [Pseudoruegeria sp.]
MKQRPLLLTGPYLAMWLWLIVPLTLHGLVPLGALTNRHVSLHVGRWIEEMDGVDSPGAVWRVLRADRAYQHCRYIRVTGHSTDLVILPPKGQHCSFLRLTQRGTGHVFASIPNKNLIETLKRNIK